MAGTVRLLLNGNGDNGSTSVTDSSDDARVITNGGAITNSTAQSQFGGASLLFPNPATSGSYLTTPYTSDIQIWSSDYTIECFIYPTSLSAATIYGTIIGNMSGGSNYWSFGPNPSGNLVFYAFNLGILSTTNTVSLNEWAHVAFSKQGNTIRLFIKGVKGHESTVSSSYPDSTSLPLTIGNYLGGYYNGYIDDLRITTGQALYVTDFTPPSSDLEPVITDPRKQAMLINNPAFRINNRIHYQGL